MRPRVRPPPSDGPRITCWANGYAPMHPSSTIRYRPLPKNLREGQREYDEHCAVCHGSDGSAKTRLEGDFHPPIVRLARGAPGLSDGQFYFILSNGIRMSGMPGFGTQQSPDDLWKIILWVRHFPN